MTSVLLELSGETVMMTARPAKIIARTPTSRRKYDVNMSPRIKIDVSCEAIIVLVVCVIANEIDGHADELSFARTALVWHVRINMVAMKQASKTRIIVW